jgi:hypothetical protein
MTALWRGQLPLGRAFWTFAVVYVALANIGATGAAFALLAADMPTALAVVVFLLPLPYVVVAVVGVCGVPPPTPDRQFGRRLHDTQLSFGGD